METQKNVANTAGDERNAQPTARTPYVRPRLTRLGSVAELTLGSGGSAPDITGGGQQHKGG